ncbi:hypothetical protein, partial [Desulfosporosinus nitroreducens]|uniref:hypothetical protein n=1 Tax=Desulfosporosinus nitroreducens TaxID=2018668 RepID=UPI00207C8987
WKLYPQGCNNQCFCHISSLSGVYMKYLDFIMPLFQNVLDMGTSLLMSEDIDEKAAPFPFENRLESKITK